LLSQNYILILLPLDSNNSTFVMQHNSHLHDCEDTPFCIQPKQVRFVWVCSLVIHRTYF